MDDVLGKFNKLTKRVRSLPATLLVYFILA
ncbi:MAG: hypothetical protein LBR11_03735 [Deltaproteobacteria bacterium]|nr:hypothetical protein [Deltaproteobacteria bacterium]